jgi:hypothetical protein
MGRCINLRGKVFFVMVAGRNYGFDKIALPRICQPHPWMPVPCRNCFILWVPDSSSPYNPPAETFIGCQGVSI